MNNERMYTSVCKMLRAYDADTNGTTAEKVIESPDKWTGPYCGEFYAAAAEMLIAIRAKMDTKTTPSTVIAAVKRIVANYPDYRPDSQGIYPYKGQFVVCDGYRLLKLHRDIASLPHCNSDFDADMAMNGVSKETLLELPTVAELKAAIAADKAGQAKKKGKFQPKPYLVDGCVWCNPQYLIDMIQALPNCKAYKPKTPTSPIYFKADNGEGVLCPVRPPEA